MASTILIGQAFGRGDGREVRRIAGTALGAFVPAAVVLSALGWWFAPELLAALGTPPSALADALAYLRVIFVALPAMLSFTLVSMALRGTGDAMTPLWFMGLSVALDSGLNPVLIAGLGPAPALGIAGAALATAIANAVALPAMVAFLYHRGSALSLRGAELAFLRPDPGLLRAVLAKGLPIGLQMIVISSAALTMLRLVNAEGVDTAAAYAVVQQLWTYVQMPAMALGAAVSAMAAQNIGAGGWDRVGRITRDGVILALALTGALVAGTHGAGGPGAAALPRAGQPCPAHCRAHRRARDLGVPGLRREPRALRHGARQRGGHGAVGDPVRGDVSRAPGLRAGRPAVAGRGRAVAVVPRGHAGDPGHGRRALPGGLVAGGLRGRPAHAARVRAKGQGNPRARRGDGTGVRSHAAPRRPCSMKGTPRIGGA